MSVSRVTASGKAGRRPARAGVRAGAGGADAPVSDAASLPATGCPLLAFDQAHAKAPRWAIIARCLRHSCPACSAHDIRKRVRVVTEAAAAWSFPRFGATMLFEPAPVADLSAALIEQCYGRAADFAAALRAHAQVVACLVKVEFDQARRCAPGVPQVGCHVHADVMTLCHAPTPIRQSLPAGAWDVEIKPGPDAGWIGYHGGPAVGKKKHRRNPQVMAALAGRVDGWQAATGHRHLYWHAGLYDGRTLRWACRGAGIHNALADAGQWPGLDGRFRRSRARAWAKSQRGVKKWGPYAGRYNGEWRVDVPSLHGEKIVAWEVKPGADEPVAGG